MKPSVARVFGWICVSLIAAALACNAPAAVTTLPVTPSAAIEPTEASLPTEATVPAAGEVTLAPSPPLEGQVRIVYTRDGSLWIVDGEADPRPLTAGATDDRPRFSPDGHWVLFERQTAPGPAGIPRTELRLIASDGSEERLLLRPDDLPGEVGVPFDGETEVLLDRVPFQIAWLSGGQQLAFNTTIEGGYGLMTRDDLWLLDIEGGNLTQLLPDGQGGIFAFSPDGSRLIVTTSTEVVMMNADGSGRRTLLSFEAVNTASEYAYYPMPVWAPDGSYALIAISSPEPFWPPEEASGTLYRLSLNGEVIPLATLRGQFLFNTMTDGLWSPDRALIAYTVPIASDSPDQVELIVAAGDGSNPRSYAAGALQFIGWAPNSTRFAYQDSSTSTIFVGTPDAPPQELIAPDTDERIVQARWAGEENLIYLVARGEDFELWLVSLSGESRRIDFLGASFPSLDVYAR